MWLISYIIDTIKFNNFFKQVARVDYIGSGEALPQPLSPEEEKNLLISMENGSEIAKNKLIEHNLRLVVFLVKKFENTGVDTEDLISIGSIGLIKAINSFSMDKNIKLATYASRCIENEILMYLRKTTKLKSEISLDEPLRTDNEGNKLLLCDILGTDADVIYKNIELKVEEDVLLKSFEKLGKKEQLIIQMRFGLNGIEEMTQKEIADMMGISQSYISRLEKKILLRLRKEMLKLI